MRVGIVSCDYDGTLAGFYELKFDKGKELFREDIVRFKKRLLLIKECEELDRIVFSLNTNENKFEVVEYALQEIFKDTEWLIPGIQFLGMDCYFYDIEASFGKSVTKYYDQIYSPGDKLNNLVNYALIVAKEETLVSVTHIEDGRDYSSDSLKKLNELDINTYIINIPSGSGRKAMLNGLDETMSSRAENCRNYVKDRNL